MFSLISYPELTLGYQPDSVRRKFTTYKRDDETGLDFAESRYYAPKWGRFTSPDEFKGGHDELFDFEETASANPTFYAEGMKEVLGIWAAARRSKVLDANLNRTEESRRLI